MTWIIDNRYDYHAYKSEAIRTFVGIDKPQTNSIIINIQPDSWDGFQEFVSLFSEINIIFQNVNTPPNIDYGKGTVQLRTVYGTFSGKSEWLMTDTLDFSDSTICPNIAFFLRYRVSSFDELKIPKSVNSLYVSNSGNFPSMVNRGKLPKLDTLGLYDCLIEDLTGIENYSVKNLVLSKNPLRKGLSHLFLVKGLTHITNSLNNDKVIKCLTRIEKMLQSGKRGWIAFLAYMNEFNYEDHELMR